jgi:hypothetical protein
MLLRSQPSDVAAVIDPVDQDLAFGGLVEAAEEVHHRRLAAAGFADDR